MTDEDSKLVWAILRMAVGEESIIKGRIWFRIDADEYKVHPEHEKTDGPNTWWVKRDREEILDVLNSRVEL
jgi:hypothetical protein